MPFRGTRLWKPEFDEKLTRLCARQATRTQIRQAFPNMRWKSIAAHAYKLGLTLPASAKVQRTRRADRVVARQRRGVDAWNWELTNKYFQPCLVCGDWLQKSKGEKVCAHHNAT